MRGLLFILCGGRGLSVLFSNNWPATCERTPKHIKFPPSHVMAETSTLWPSSPAPQRSRTRTRRRKRPASYLVRSPGSGGNSKIRLAWSAAGKNILQFVTISRKMVCLQAYRQWWWLHICDEHYWARKKRDSSWCWSLTDTECCTYSNELKIQIFASFL